MGKLLARFIFSCTMIGNSHNPLLATLSTVTGNTAKHSKI